MLNSFKYSNEIFSNEKLESYISRVASTLIELTKNGFEVRFFLFEKTVFEAAVMTVYKSLTMTHTSVFARLSINRSNLFEIASHMKYNVNIL